MDDDPTPWAGAITEGAGVAGGRRPRGSGRPTVRQIYALAAALCEQADERFPETFEEASELIERLRRENGHPAPLLEDTPPRLRRRRRRRTLVITYGGPVPEDYDLR